MQLSNRLDSLQVCLKSILHDNDMVNTFTQQNKVLFIRIKKFVFVSNWNCHHFSPPIHAAQLDGNSLLIRVDGKTQLFINCTSLLIAASCLFGCWWSELKHLSRRILNGLPQATYRILMVFFVWWYRGLATSIFWYDSDIKNCRNRRGFRKWKFMAEWGFWHTKLSIRIPWRRLLGGPGDSHWQGH